MFAQTITSRGKMMVGWFGLARLTPLWPWDALLKSLERFCLFLQLATFSVPLLCALWFKELDSLGTLPFFKISRYLMGVFSIMIPRFQCPFRLCHLWWFVSGNFIAILALIYGMAANIFFAILSWSFELPICLCTMTMIYSIWIKLSYSNTMTRGPNMQWIFWLLVVIRSK